MPVPDEIQLEDDYKAVFGSAAPLCSIIENNERRRWLKVFAADCTYDVRVWDAIGPSTCAWCCFLTLVDDDGTGDVLPTSHFTAVLWSSFWFVSPPRPRLFMLLVEQMMCKL